MYLEAWKDWNFIDWVDGLGLTTRPWIRPFLEPMGLPSCLCDDPDLWNDLYWNAREQYDLLATVDWIACPDDEWDVWSYINFDVLKTAFDTLAARTNLETAELFCLWYNRHFEMTRFNWDLHAWRWVLIRAIWHPDKLVDKIVVPECFELIKENLEQLVWFDSESFRLKLQKVPVTFLLKPDGPDRNGLIDAILSRTNAEGIIENPEHEDLFGDASIVLDVIERESALKALKIINSSPARNEIMEYLHSCAEILGLYSLKLSDREILELFGLEKC